MSMAFSPISERTQVVQDTTQLQTQLTHLQDEEASNTVYTEPDQAPSIVVQSMTLTHDLSEADWDQTRLTTANTVLSTTNGALESMVNLIHQASALAVQASNTANQIPGGLEALVTTAHEYVQQFASLLNTQSNGVYVFAGADPFQPVTTGASITNAPAPGSTAWAWSLPVQPGVSVTISANGYEAGIAPGSTSVFQNTLSALQGLATAIQSGHPSTAEAALSSVANQLNTLTTYMGAQQNNVQTYAQQASTAALAAQTAISTLDTPDLPSVLSQVAADTTAYEAALQSTDTLLQMSLWNDITA